MSTHSADFESDLEEARQFLFSADGPLPPLSEPATKELLDNQQLLKAYGDAAFIVFYLAESKALTFPDPKDPQRYRRYLSGLALKQFKGLKVDAFNGLLNKVHSNLRSYLKVLGFTPIGR
jgi:hypothetical protein